MGKHIISLTTLALLLLMSGYVAPQFLSSGPATLFEVGETASADGVLLIGVGPGAITVSKSVSGTFTKWFKVGDSTIFGTAIGVAAGATLSVTGVLLEGFTGDATALVVLYGGLSGTWVAAF